MNQYVYDDISIGHSETFTVTVTEEMFASFGAISGDTNPLHNDESFAQRVGYRSKVAYGMLTASFLSTLAGVYLPGLNSLIHRIEAEFPAPVYVGDVLTFTGEVVQKHDDFRVIELRITARSESGKKVLRGKMRVGVLR